MVRKGIISSIISSPLFNFMSSIFSFIVPGFMTSLAFKHKDVINEIFWLKYWIIASPMLAIGSIFHSKSHKKSKWDVISLISLIVLQNNASLLDIVFSTIVHPVLMQMEPVIKSIYRKSLENLSQIREPLSQSHIIGTLLDNITNN